MALSISHIQTFSLHDGPGIRTTVFLSGCPLRCLWCHNPETQSSKPQLLFDYRKCIYCGACSVCPNGVHRFEDGHILLRNSCDGCGLCVRNCPTEALSFSVRILSTEKFIKLAKEQDAIFGADGGITFSGGEPLLQWQELLRLSELVQFFRAAAHCGIQALQINCVNQEDLLKAQKDPENYRHIIVRVCGFSAPCVLLSPTYQEEFLSRMFHDV